MAGLLNGRWRSWNVRPRPLPQGVSRVPVTTALRTRASARAPGGQTTGLDETRSSADAEVAPAFRGGVSVSVLRARA